MSPADYAENGYARLQGAIDVDAARAAADWVVRHRTRSDVPQARDLLDRSQPLPLKLRRLWQCDPVFWAAFLRRSGALGVARRWLGEAFLLIRSAAFIKYPASRSTVGWHCDEHLWGHACEAGLTVWVPLTPVPVDSGCLAFRPGSHRAPPGRLYWDARHPYHKVMDTQGLADPVHVPADLGDCIVMDKATVHASGPNRCAQERMGLVLAFARCTPDVLTETAVQVDAADRFHPVGQAA